MAISVFDVFKPGIGPSSSHTMGPMVAACRFMSLLQSGSFLDTTVQVRVSLYCSLALTGKGHGTDKAIVLGLAGYLPAGVDPDEAGRVVRDICDQGYFYTAGNKKILFSYENDIVFCPGETLPQHPNGMRFQALDENDIIVLSADYLSVGGGAVETAENYKGGHHVPPRNTTAEVPYPFKTAADLLSLCHKTALPVCRIVMENEKALHAEDEAGINHRLDEIWEIMKQCMERGLRTPGQLPVSGIKRRAPEMYAALVRQPQTTLADHFVIMDWIMLYAMAVNEENACGGRVVTAPTNGGAGVLPAVLMYYLRFNDGANREGVRSFLLTAAAIGMLYKMNASVSGAEVGCQGEVGVACSMSAAALTAVKGGTVAQVENAAEIAMEHHLGMTCDPIGGLVQIPCIERNGVAAVKAITASRLALRGSGDHQVSLDSVIETMYRTGKDMQSKYRETAAGGLAVFARKPDACC